MKLNFWLAEIVVILYTFLKQEKLQFDDSTFSNNEVLQSLMNCAECKYAVWLN